MTGGSALPAHLISSRLLTVDRYAGIRETLAPLVERNRLAAPAGFERAMKNVGFIVLFLICKSATVTIVLQ